MLKTIWKFMCSNRYPVTAVIALAVLIVAAILLPERIRQPWPLLAMVVLPLSWAISLLGCATWQLGEGIVEYYDTKVNVYLKKRRPVPM